MTDSFKKRILPVIVVIAGFAFLLSMAALKSDPPKKTPEKRIPSVSVMTAKAESIRLTIGGSGSVRSTSEITLVPQVGGKIVYRSAKMITGGSFKKGDVLYRIDPRDYQLNYDVAAAEVARQEVQIEMEKQENRIAKEEWAQYQKDNPDESASELTLRKPQMELAQANLKAAQARLRIAKLALERTAVRAPFNGTVRLKRMDVGQFVNVGSNLAEILSTERAEIEVSLDPEFLDYFDFSKGAAATLSRELAGKTQNWQGSILQGGGSLDQKSRLMTVTVEVNNPYAQTPPLLIGYYVNVLLNGKNVDGIIRVPRHAVRANTVWVHNGGKLEIKDVSVLKYQDGDALIASGIAAGDEIVTSELDVAVAGMAVKVEK